MIDIYNLLGGDGQVLSIRNSTLSWIDPPKCCCDDGQTQRKKIYNCPNCGAPITGPRCAYCDTLLVEPTYYQFNIPYSGGVNCNIRQQLEEAQMRAAQSAQTNFIMANAIQSISLYPYESGLRIDKF